MEMRLAPAPLPRARRRSPRASCLAPLTARPSPRLALILSHTSSAGASTNSRGAESRGKGGVQISINGGITWLPEGGGVFNVKDAGMAMEDLLKGGSSGNSKDGANSWRNTISANLVKPEVLLPSGAKITSYGDSGALIVPHRPFARGPYKSKDLRVRKLAPKM